MNLYGYAIAAAVLAGAGATAWHWAPLIGPQAQFVAKDKRIEKLVGEVEAAKAETDRVTAERDQCKTAATEAGDTAAQEAERMARMSRNTYKGAFDAGYASRRCTDPPVGGVRDLRSLQEAGAFRAGGDLPAKPEGGD